MPIFGDRSDFAIEAGVEPDCHTPSTVWCHMCVWCVGSPLGNIHERYCGLYHAYCSFQWLAANYQTLWAEELATLDDLAQLNFLDEKVYGYHGEVKVVDFLSMANDRPDRHWNRFDFLTNWGEQFDGYKAFLVCQPGGRIKILSRDLPESVKPGVTVSREGFETASRAFTNWFDSESHRLGIPSGCASSDET